jgi:hypothetical protein
MSGSFSSLAALVQNFESGGDYGAQSQTSTASGAYQFINSTWLNYAGQAGIDTSAYPTAVSAPPAVQDAVFAQAVQSNGLNDWTCPGCDAPLSNYLAANPGALSLPVLSTSGPATGSGTVTGTSSPAMPASTAPVSGTTGAAGKSSGSVFNPATWFSALGGWIASVAARGGLFLLGTIFVLGAIALLAVKSGIEIETNAER